LRRFFERFGEGTCLKKPAFHYLYFVINIDGDLMKDGGYWLVNSITFLKRKVINAEISI